MAITTLGTHQGFAVVEQDIEGLATLHVIADEGKGQWDVFPLLAHTLDEARVAIDQWLVYENATDADFDVDEAALLAKLGWEEEEQS